ncbi:family 16 glycosylhydrolase [Kocuria aegyptia]|uniref:GH16 domain-containing protein n=1 Tax=Kocuria aegyptia TaxID=330943 RepID=A0ABN2KXD6_9MICC
MPVSCRRPTTPIGGTSYNITPNEWHVWAVEWLPSRLTFYVDGLKVYEVTDTEFIPTKPFHFAAQLEIGVPGGTLDIPVRNSCTPQPLALHIDYVRMYKTDVTIPSAGGGVS